MEVVVTAGLLELVVQSFSQIITTNKPTSSTNDAVYIGCEIQIIILQNLHKKITQSFGSVRVL